MSINIMDVVKGYITPDLISKASSFLGEGENNVSKAVSGIVPALLSGVSSKITEGGAGASGIFDAIKGFHSNNVLSSVSNFANDGGGFLKQGLGFVQNLFGDKLGGIVSSIASFAGIKNSSASSLLNMAGPLVGGAIGKQISDNNFSLSSLGSFLGGQKSNIASMLPAGLSSLAGLIGIGKIGNTLKASAKEVSNIAGHAGDTVKKSSRLLPWVLFAALAALIIWFISSKGCGSCKKPADANVTVAPDVDNNHHSNPVEPIVSSVKGALDSLGNFIYDIGAETEIKLQDGTTLKVGETSTEAKLFNMLHDASFSVDTVNKSKNWIVLDRVYFETGKSVLKTSSQAQVKNIAAILKNFPAASIKLGGYTDNTGDAAINKKVSEQRAKIVAKELIKLGAGAKQVVEAVGYGPEFPVCDANDTPECKAQNRRVDLKVSTK